MAEPLEESKKKGLNQLGGIRSYLKEAVTAQGVEYNEDVEKDMLSRYKHNYSDLIKDVGKTYGVPDDNLEDYKNDVFSQYEIAQPDEHGLAEMSFLAKPLDVEGEEGYDRYKRLEDDLSLAATMRQKLESPKEPTTMFDTYEAEQSSTAIKPNIDLSLEDDALRPEAREERIQQQYKEQRIIDLDDKMNELNDAIAAQAELNRGKYGYVSQKHEQAITNFENYSALLDNTIKHRREQIENRQSKTPSSNFRAEEYEKIQSLRGIKDMYQEMGKLLGSPQGSDFDSQMEGLLHGFSDNFFTKDFATLGINEMSRLLNVKDAFDNYTKIKDKFVKDNDLSGLSDQERNQRIEEEVSNIMPTDQKNLLDTYQLLLQIQAGNKANFMTGVGEGLKEMLPFIAQFAATGGAGAGAKKAVGEFIKAKTRSAVSGRVAGAIAKPLAQGALMIPANLQNYANRVAPTMDEEGNLKEGAKPLNAAFKAYLSTVAEVVGEDVGSFANKWANGVARKGYMKMIANDPNMAQKFLGKMSLMLTADTGVPSVQGVLFEGIGEEATGIMQAAIDNDGSFFTPEAQAQLWVMSAMASGGFAAASGPKRIATKLKYDKSEAMLNDLANEDYANAVKDVSQSIEDPVEMERAFNDLSKEFDISEQEFNTARAFVGSSIAHSQMNVSRALKIQQRIMELEDTNGNVTTTVLDGKSYVIRNPEALEESNGMVLLKDTEGNSTATISSRIDKTLTETKTPTQIVDETISNEDMDDQAMDQEQKLQEEALSKGLEEGKTVETPHGKKTLIAVNPDGTSTVVDAKGEESIVNTSEIEAYKTKEQQEAEKVQAEANQAMMEGIEEGAEVISDEPLTETEDVRVVDFNNGQSKIITPEGEQVFNTPEERDAAVKELTLSEIETVQDETSIDDLPPEEAFASMLKDDPESAKEVFAEEIGDIRSQANELMSQAKESSSRKEKMDLRKKAKSMEAEAARLEQILADPAVLEQQEQVAEPLEPEIPREEQLINEYQVEKENIPENSLQPWQKELIGSKINRDSFLRWSDKSNINKQMAMSWFAPKADRSSSNDIDNVAKDLSETHGIEITPQDIIDTIHQFPGNYVRKTTDRMNDIAREYKEITGKPIVKEQTTIEAPEGMATDVVDDPIATAEAPVDVPFRAKGVNVSDKARNDLKSKRRVESTLNELEVKFGIPIEVINSSEMPQHVIDAAKGKKIQASGFYDPTTKKAYVISDNAGRISEIKKTYLHEAILHRGLDALFEAGPVGILGKQFDTKSDLLGFVFDKMDDQTIGGRAKDYFKDWFNENMVSENGKYSLKEGATFDTLSQDQKMELAEEALATLNETESPRLQVVLDKLYNYIKKLLGFTSKQFSKSDFRNLLREHRELVMKQSKEGVAPVESKSTEPTKFRTDEGQTFEEWKGNNEYVEDYQIQDVKTGQPIVAKVYHGTTHSFTEFKGGEVGDIEGHLGATNYFTSEVSDAEGNYGAEGADLTGRIEQRKDQLSFEVEQHEGADEFDYEAISDEFDIPVDDIKDFDNADDIAQAIAEKELKGDDEQVMELYVKLNNPLVLGDNHVYIETIDEADIEPYIEDAAQEIADEYDVDIDEAKDDYSFEIRERAIEESGAEDRVIAAFQLALEAQNIYDKTIHDFLPEYYGGEVDLTEIESQLRSSEELLYIENEKGELANTQIISDFLEELGYDGVILRDVSERFSNMGLSEYTSHIHVPDQYSNQIKLADGSNTTFGESSDIRFRVAESQQELEDFVKDSKVKETVYHGTKSEFEDFEHGKSYGSGDAFGYLGKGFYFTNDLMTAESYAGEGVNMEVRLSLKNPYVTTDGRHTSPSAQGSFARDLGLDPKKPQEVSDYLKEQGYDGVIAIDESDDYREYMVFSNDQILIEPTESKPSQENIKFQVEEARQQADINPTESQKQAGNYKMGHVKFDGFDISIENPKGSIRSGRDADGKEWSNIMPAEYGYFKNTKGADKDHIDVFLGNNPESDKVYVVDQINPDTGKFDEHKIMMGYNSVSEARNAYNEAYDEGWQGLGAITKTTKDGLKEWFKGDTTKPFAPKDDVKFRVQSDNPEVQALLDKLQVMEDKGKVASTIKEGESKIKEMFPEMRDEAVKLLGAFKVGTEAGKEDALSSVDSVQKAITDYAKKTLPLTNAGARELGSLLTLIKNSKTPESLKKAFNKIDELTGKTTDRVDLKKATSKVNRLMKWMTKIKPVSKFNYQDTKDFIELKDINDKAVALNKKSNSWKSSAEDKIEAEKQLDELWESINEKDDKSDMDNAMMKLIELRRLGSKATPKLAQTVAEELQAIYEKAKEAKSEVDMQKAMRRKEDKNMIKSFLNSDTAIKDLRWYKKAKKQFNTKVADKMGNWETLMTMIGGTKLRDKMTFLNHEADMEVGKQASRNNILDAAKEIYGIKGKVSTLNHIHDLSAEDYELRQPNVKGMAGEGKPMDLSKLHLIDIYNAVKNEDVANDYYMSYGDIMIDANGNRDIDAQKADGEARINELLSNLDSKDEAFADAMQKELDKYYDKLNEVHIKRFNRDLPRVENYWPSTAKRAKDIDVMEQFFIDSRHPSSLKERSAHRTPIPKDAFNKFTRHVDEAEWYINMALPIDYANKLFSDINIEALINDARGDKFYTHIGDAIKDLTLNPPSQAMPKGELDKLLNPLLNNWVASKIGATPSVPLKQLLSAVNYSENMPTGQWVKGFGKAISNPAKTWKEMMDIPYLKARLGDGYSEAVQRALSGDENTHQSKAANFHNQFKQWMTAGTRYGDIVAIMFGGKPYLDFLIKENTKENIDSGMSEAEAKTKAEKDAVDAFLRDTLRSQQSPFNSSLSKLQNSKNVFARAMFTFSNTPSQYMRKLFEANQDLRVKKQQYKAGKIRKDELNKARKQTFKAHQIYALINTVSFTMAGSLINAVMKGSGPDDEIWKDMLAQLSATYVGGLPIIKDILDTTTRLSLGMDVYDDVNPYVAGLTGVVEEGIKLAQGRSKDEGKSYDKIAQGVADMVGVPYQNFKKDLKALPPLRSQTVKETRVKEADKKLQKLGKSDDSFLSEAVSELKSSYRLAKSNATKLRKKGKDFQADKIMDLIDESKVTLWKTDFSTVDVEGETKYFKRKYKEID